jgi:hypothetical protein
MCWDGNSGSWCEWDKTGKRFGYFGGGELEVADLGSGIGDRVHSSVYPYFDGCRSLDVGVLLALGGHELAPI